MQRSTNSFIMLLLVILLYALFGFTFTLGKIVLFYATPFFIIATRMIIGGGALLGYIIWHRTKTKFPEKHDLWLYAVYTFFNIYIFYGARSWALQTISTTKAALLMNLSPFFTALFAYFLLKEKLSMHKLIGLVIGFSGMIPMLMTHTSPEENMWWNFAFFSTPELVMIFAVACLSYSMIIMQKLVKHRNHSPLLVNALCMISGGVLAGGTSLIFETNVLFGDKQLFALAIGLQIIISNILCSNLQAFLLKSYSTTFLSFASFISPLCAAGYGYLLLNEQITWLHLLSFCIVILGLTIFYFDDFKKSNT